MGAGANPNISYTVAWNMLACISSLDKRPEGLLCVGRCVQGHLHAGECLAAPKNARTSPPRSVSIEPLGLLLRTLGRRVRGSVERQRSIAAGTVDASGRMPHRERDRRQPGG